MFAVLLTHNMRQIDLYANCTHALFDSFTHATFSPFFSADNDDGDTSLLPNTYAHVQTHTQKL